ncbi:MAG: hypothetical protein PVG39_01205 [Desulfobacteraceae bacterium]
MGPNKRIEVLGMCDFMLCGEEGIRYSIPEHMRKYTGGKDTLYLCEKHRKYVFSNADMRDVEIFKEKEKQKKEKRKNPFNL